MKFNYAEMGKMKFNYAEMLGAPPSWEKRKFIYEEMGIVEKHSKLNIFQEMGGVASMWLQNYNHK
jgi:hypothetical protein